MDASRTLKNRRGIALVYLAFLLFALVAIAGLVIDFGYMYVSKSQLQNSADAGALAGASKLNGLFTNHSAHYYAQKFASDPGNKAAGEIVPVALNFENYSGGDTVVGCWNGSFHSTSVTGCTEANAIKVVARRTTESGGGISNQNKPVDIFLGRILGEQWKKLSAKAIAIAINKKANIAPIIVNEYWLGLSSDPPGSKPYGTDQNYPNSFVRNTNVNGSSSLVFGKTFALFGQRADNNRAGGNGQGVTDNVNGYINLTYRSSDYLGSAWYQANDTSTCPSCSFSSASGLTEGTINSEKFDTLHLNYLFNGLDMLLPPIPVIENYSPSYPTVVTPPTPSSSPCPYSTIAYFSTGGAGIPSLGGDPLQQSFGGKSFIEQFPPGKKIITLVYDGIPAVGGTGPNAVTAVGYSLIQIDGYSNNNPKQLGHNNFFDTGGNVVDTMYGHALSNIIENNGGSVCDFMDKLSIIQYQAGTVKLVK